MGDKIECSEIDVDHDTENCSMALKNNAEQKLLSP